jgi:hypothetical protein
MTGAHDLLAYFVEMRSHYLFDRLALKNDLSVLCPQKPFKNNLLNVNLYVQIILG